MPVAVPLIGAAVSVGGGLLASSSAKKAGNQAAAAQQYAADQTVAEQRRQFDITQGNFAPFLQAGQSALTAQTDLLGLGGFGAIDETGATGAGRDRQALAIEQLQQSPLYQSLFANGQNTILANSAATGGLRGGNIQGSLANFGRDTLSQVIQTQLANLGQVAGQGQSAAGSIGAFGANAANQIGQAYGDAGSAQAGAYLNAGKANVGNINNIAGALGGIVGNTGIQTAIGKLF